MRLAIVTHETYTASVEWSRNGHGRSVLVGKGASPEIARADLAVKIVMHCARDDRSDSIALVDELLRRAMERDP